MSDQFCRPVARRCSGSHWAQSVDSMKFVASQGSVFGARTGGNWKFYIQKRVLVEYFHDTPRTSLGRQQLILAVQQFWPNRKTGSLVA